MQLLISSPWWFIVLCILAGFMYAFILYKKDFRKPVFRIMTILRFISVSLICFFLLSPVIVRETSTVEKPKILMVLDNSESISAGNEASWYKSTFLDKWFSAAEKLGQDYEVEFLDLSGNILKKDSFAFTLKKTNLSRFFDHVNNTYARQNAGAVLLASDGIYNRGSNPLYKELNNHVVLYSIGMGDTMMKKDAVVKDANANAIAYLNNSFPVEINLSAYACNGSKLNLTLVSEGKTLYNEVIQVNNEDYFKNLIVNIEADKPGTKHVIVQLSTVPGEVTTVNNRKDVFIDIIDGREKVLLVYHGPHPDIGAIKDAILNNKNYEVISMQASELSLNELSKYSVAVLHQLPSRTYNSRELISSLRKNKIPIWCIAGKETVVDMLSAISPVAKVDRSQGRFNESQPVLNESFNVFTLDDATKKTIYSFPPLQVPYGSYASSGSADILAYQKIGSVNTKNPIWTFSNQDDEKTAILFGEGFWKWRLTDYLENESHIATNELVSKTIQYLAVKEDKRKFRVYPVKNTYEEDEAVRFIAELYNASYELVNEADIKLRLVNSEKKVFDFTFSRVGASYQLDLGVLAPGNYTFTAQAAGIPDKISGKVLISPLQAELVNTRADFGLLRNIASRNDGRFYNARQIDDAINDIRKNTEITTVSYSEKKPDDLINLKWIFFLILVLISAEWFIRKYEGAY